MRSRNTVERRISLDIFTGQLRIPGSSVCMENMLNSSIYIPLANMVSYDVSSLTDMKSILIGSENEPVSDVE
jgi:hypothetical protein